MRLLVGAALLTGCPWVGADGLQELRDGDGDGLEAQRFGGRDCDDLDPNVGDCDLDRDGYLAAGFGDDCDDADPEVHPDAEERCAPAGVDEDCDGRIDDADAVDSALATAWFVDGDGDGFGADTPVFACLAPVGTVDNNLDCDDTTSSVAPDQDERCDPEDRDCDGDPMFGAVDAVDWYGDGDGDGFGRADAFVATACEAPAGTGRIEGGLIDDCDDTDPDRNPAAQEVCGGLDDDCDGFVDADDPSVVADVWYRDEDGDGLGQTATVLRACGQPVGHVDTPGDCNDGDATIALDRAWYPDLDGDGFGDDSAQPLVQCGQPAGHVASGGDCDDGRASVNDTQQELCNGFDDNCDGLADDDDPSVAAGYPWYFDADADGFGVVDASSPIYACVRPEGTWTGLAGDCDDDASNVSPVIPEQCNGVDDNCDGSIDVNANDQVTWYPDMDEDGFGDATAAPTFGCPAGSFALNDDDCDDTDAGLGPIERWYRDADGDGFGVSGVFVDSCAAPSGFALESGDCDDNDPAVQFAVAFVPGDFDTIAQAASRVCAGGAVLLDPTAGPHPVRGVINRDLLIASQAAGEPAQVCAAPATGPSPPGPALGAPLVTVAEDIAVELVDLEFVNGAEPVCAPDTNASPWLRATPGSRLALQDVEVRVTDLAEVWVGALGSELVLADVGLDGVTWRAGASEEVAIRSRAGSVDIEGMWARDIQGTVLNAEETQDLRVLQVQLQAVVPEPGRGALEVGVTDDGVLRAIDAQASGTAIVLESGELDLTSSRFVGGAAPHVRICDGVDAYLGASQFIGAGVEPFAAGVPCPAASDDPVTSLRIDGSVFVGMDTAIVGAAGSGVLRSSVFVDVGSVPAAALGPTGGNASDGMNRSCAQLTSCPTQVCFSRAEMRFALFDDPCDASDPVLAPDRWLLGPAEGSTLIGANRPLPSRLLGDFGLTSGNAAQTGWVDDEDGDGLPDTWELYFGGSNTAIDPGTVCPANSTYCVDGGGYAAGTWPVVPVNAFPLQDIPLPELP